MANNRLNVSNQNNNMLNAENNRQSLNHSDAINANSANAINNNAKTCVLAICEPFHPVLHGQDENSTPAIEKHFLVYTLVDLSEFYNNAYADEERSYRRYRKAINCLHHETINKTHPSLRAYTTIANKHIRLEIIQPDELKPGQEAVAYLKTFWLRIVQRCWKKIFQQRQAILKERTTLKALREHERTGKWKSTWPPFRLNLRS